MEKAQFTVQSSAFPASSSPGAIPLVVDLDGTLIRTDMLHESSVQLFRSSPLSTLRIPLWLREGKAALKRQLASRTSVNAAHLPYNEEFLAWLRQQREAGRQLILCTASDHGFAEAVAAHCGVFDDVMASDGVTNLDGARKAKALVSRFGAQGFDYAGNSNVDVAVWQQARQGVVVDAPGRVLAKAEASCRVEKVFPPPARKHTTWARALRAHHWLKNVLLFVPLFAGHQLDDPAVWLHMVLAFFAFSLCASAVYVANDLMDLESDRMHPRKRLRPFAAGTLAVSHGVIAIPVLALTSLVLSIPLGPAFFGWLSAYFALTWAYSWWLKRIALVDCLTLAGLYTLRVVAGSAAAGLTLSFWLLAFSGFLFLSLAFVKRYAELLAHQAAGKTHAHGRGYATSDLPVVQMLGIVSGYTAVVVLALYLNSDAVTRLYRAPELAWGVVPVMVYWVSRMWLQASRGEMHDDPLVHAFKDGASLIAGALFGLFLLVGSVGLRW